MYLIIHTCGAHAQGNVTPAVSRLEEWKRKKSVSGKGGGQVFGKKLPVCLSFRTTAKFRSLIRRALHVLVKLN